MKSIQSLPLLASFLTAALLADAVAQSGPRYDERNRGYREAEFYDDRGPVADLFHDIKGEIKYQRYNFWDGIRGLRQDVRRAFNNDTPAMRSSREREEYERLEREYESNRFGYSGAPALKPASNRQPRGTSSRTSNVPMDERFFENQSREVRAPANQRSTTATPGRNSQTQVIVRPTPPVSGSVQPSTPGRGPLPNTDPSDDFAPLPDSTQKIEPKPEPEPKKRIFEKEKDSGTNEAAKEKENDAAKYPTATPSGQKGIVRSPFAPHEELDVTGMKSGDLAIDPGNGRIFRVP